MANFTKSTPGAACRMVDALNAAWGYKQGRGQEAYTETGELVAYKDPDGYFILETYADLASAPPAISNARASMLEKIASETLDLDTLDTQGSDRLDFHDLAVWSLKAALNAAYEAGRNERMA